MILYKYAEMLKLRMPLNMEVVEKSRCLPSVSRVITKLFGCKIREPKYCLKAEYSRDRKYMFDEDSPQYFDENTRIYIAYYILVHNEQVKCSNAERIESLLYNQVYSALFPLHDGSLYEEDKLRYSLLHGWASLGSMLKFQPNDVIKGYFGHDVAVCFAMMGYHTYMQYIPIILVVFVNILTLCISMFDIKSVEAAGSDSNIIMCPMCDKYCGYRVLKLSTGFVHVLTAANVFVFFSLMMSVWAALYLQFWKRYRVELIHRWGLLEHTYLPEVPRPVYIERFDALRKIYSRTTQRFEPVVSFWKYRFPAFLLSFVVVLCAILVIFICILYIMVYQWLQFYQVRPVEYEIGILKRMVHTLIYFIAIILLEILFTKLFTWLTSLEAHRTQSRYNRSMSIKKFVLHFFNYYSLIFYVAFVKGHLVHHPGYTLRLFGQRMEECSADGCLVELLIVLWMILILKDIWQLFYGVTTRNSLKNKFRLANDNSVTIANPNVCVNNYALLEWSASDLHKLYLDLAIQYGFIHLFISTSVYIPIFVVLRNIIYIRLKANVLLTEYRRPMPSLSKSLDMWHFVLHLISIIAIVANSFLIGFTLPVIPKLVYSILKPGGSLRGFVEFQLSYFDTRDFSKDVAPLENPLNITTCRYFGYRFPPGHPQKYELDDLYWQVLVARLAFVIIYQVVVIAIATIIMWMIPDIPKKVKSRIEKENFEFEEFIHSETLKRKADLPGEETVDYVLVYKSSQLENRKRILFEEELQYTCVIVGTEVIKDYHFTKIRVPMDTLCEYSEILKLRMPLNFGEEVAEPSLSKFSQLVNKRTLRCCKPNVDLFPKQKYRMTAVFSRDKDYMFDVDADFFDASTRILVASYILDCVTYGGGNHDQGIKNLIAEKVYKAALPLHDGPLHESNTRSKLFTGWAAISNWKKFQPIDEIKDYFGDKVALYFSWMGYYNSMLFVASVAGVCCLTFGAFTMAQRNLSDEICTQNVTMCPLCDEYCGYWNLRVTCLHAKVNYLMDNESMVLFSMFMTIWGAVLCLYWKSYTSVITHRWGLVNYNLMAEPPRSEYLERLRGVHEFKLNEVTRLPEPIVPFWKLQCPTVFMSCTVVLVWCLLGIGLASSIVLYRMAMRYSHRLHAYKITRELYVIPMTGAGLNLIGVTVLDVIYRKVIESLTKLELHRTDTEYQDSLSLKIYVFSFVTYYSSIFYIAFIKGKFIGYPGNPAKIFGFRSEECRPGGCMMELTIQLFVIMVGRQMFTTIKSILIPMLLMNKCLRCVTRKFRRRGVIPMDEYNLYVENYNLLHSRRDPLRSDYLEMVMQFGFITIFASAFPLAPLCALINNIIEMRLNAIRMLKYCRRPVMKHANSIGAWSKIMTFIYGLSILTNSCIIAFNSRYIRKIVYHITSQRDEGASAYMMTFELSQFAVKDFPKRVAPRQGGNVTTCSYLDFRHPPDHPKKYQITILYWYLLVTQLIFVIIYLAFMLTIITCIQLMIPSIPRQLRDLIQFEELKIRSKIYRHRLRRETNQLALRTLSEDQFSSKYLIFEDEPTDEDGVNDEPEDENNDKDIDENEGAERGNRSGNEKNENEENNEDEGNNEENATVKQNADSRTDEAGPSQVP